MPDNPPKKLKIGYLMNTYPLPSTTFVRTEIHAHEAASIPVARFAIRPWDEGELVDPIDREEKEITQYLLKEGFAKLIFGGLLETVKNPLGMARALASTFALALKAPSKKLFPLAYLLESIQLKALTSADAIDHLHVHFSTNSAAVAMLSRRLGGPSYSFTVHGPDELPEMAQFGLKAKMRHSKFVVAITDYCKSKILESSDGEMAEKVHVTRCGIDLTKFSTAPVSAAHFDDNYELVCIGRLCEQKAQTLLVSAVSKLKSTHPKLRLTLIGDGDTRPEIERLIEQNGLDDMVTLAGWGTSDQVKDALGRCRAMILPSFAEGLPIVIMEAMAMQRPVISTRIAGIPELLDERCGWIIPAGDEEALVGALKACMDSSSETLATLAREGYERVQKMHDQTKNAAELRRLIGLI